MSWVKKTLKENDSRVYWRGWDKMVLNLTRWTSDFTPRITEEFIWPELVKRERPFCSYRLRKSLPLKCAWHLLLESLCLTLGSGIDLYHQSIHSFLHSWWKKDVKRFPIGINTSIFFLNHLKLTQFSGLLKKWNGLKTLTWFTWSTPKSKTWKKTMTQFALKSPSIRNFRLKNISKWDC